MGLLDKLWDDTLAGPQPDSGLGKLRKYPSFRPKSNVTKEAQLSPLTGSSTSTEIGEVPRITRSITIVKPPGYGSPPVSPAGSTPPLSPFSGGREPFRFRRKSTSDAFEKATAGVGARSPTTSYDV